MNEHWLEITQAGRMQRHELLPGSTTIGGGNARLSLEGVGRDQLELVPDPWRVAFRGSGPPPFCDGAPLTEQALVGGTRIEWAGIRIEFREQAQLQELDAGVPIPKTGGAPGRASLDPMEENAWSRVRAGLLVDTGQVPREVVKRWQAQVLEGPLDTNGCAAELNACVPALDVRVAERAGRLMRDFLMASKLQGAAGAARATRTATKSLLSMLIAQALAISVYSAIVFGCMIFIRKGGYSFDGLYDAILGFFGVK